MTQIQKFNPVNIRQDVVKQMEAMQTSKFVQLPENYKESVFFAMDKLTTLPDINMVPSTDITKTLINMFSNKLDFRKNHCYFFVQNDKNSPTGKSLRFGWQYQGRIHVAKTQCGVEEVLPVLITEGDTFETHYQDGALIIDQHIPTFSGKITGGYCVVVFQNGSRLVRYYTREELDMRRNKSKAPKGNFWAWEREMYEKTLINATVERIIETSSDTTIDDSFYEEPKEERQIVDAEIIIQDEPQEIPEKVESSEPEVFELT